MRNNKSYIRIIPIVMCLIFISCGTKKTITDNGTSPIVKGNDKETTDAKNASLLRKVYDNEVYTKSLSSKIKFTINTESKDISVSGSLKMRKDEVIRIQLTLFGLMEAGRLEFTKDYVLIMDRINKEYVKATYSEVDFLSRNGLDFYALQALFWNRLYMPGTQNITETSLQNFSVIQEGDKNDGQISLSRGSMEYLWTVDNISGLIKNVEVTYNSKTNGTTRVKCIYDSFRPLGAKKFPADMTLKLNSNMVKSGKTMCLNIAMNDFDTSDGWDAKTAVSAKYKKVNVEDVMNRLLSL